jgi:hypothetical protein
VVTSSNTFLWGVKKQSLRENAGQRSKKKDVTPKKIKKILERGSGVD